MDSFGSLIILASLIWALTCDLLKNTYLISKLYIEFGYACSWVHNYTWFCDHTCFFDYTCLSNSSTCFWFTKNCISNFCFTCGFTLIFWYVPCDLFCYHNVDVTFDNLYLFFVIYITSLSCSLWLYCLAVTLSHFTIKFIFFGSFFGSMIEVTIEVNFEYGICRNIWAFDLHVYHVIYISLLFEHFLQFFYNFPRLLIYILFFHYHSKCSTVIRTCFVIILQLSWASDLHVFYFSTMIQTCHVIFLGLLLWDDSAIGWTHLCFMVCDNNFWDSHARVVVGIFINFIRLWW